MTLAAGPEPQRVHRLGAEHGAPAHPLLNARRATHDVGDLARLYHTAIRGELTFPIFVRTRR